jgi:plasmid stabilization system protein ParE
LTRRRVRFTSTAQEHVRREKAWWLASRDYPDVFADELQRVLEILSTLPGVGSEYSASPVAGVRRVYLRRSSVHVYYSFNDREVLVRAVWGARLEHGPDITSDPT